MSSQAQGGVNRILRAEKKAAQRIEEARRRRVVRLKQAANEAKIEIERIRSEREAQFQNFVRETSASCEIAASRVNIEAQKRISELNSQASINKDEVIEQILQLVCDIKPELHANYLLLKEAHKNKQTRKKRTKRTDNNEDNPPAGDDFGQTDGIYDGGRLAGGSERVDQHSSRKTRSFFQNASLFPSTKGGVNYRYGYKRLFENQIVIPRRSYLNSMLIGVNNSDSDNDDAYMSNVVQEPSDKTKFIEVFLPKDKLEVPLHSINERPCDICKWQPSTLQIVNPIKKSVSSNLKLTKKPILLKTSETEQYIGIPADFNENKENELRETGQQPKDESSVIVHVESNIESNVVKAETETSTQQLEEELLNPGQKRVKSVGDISVLSGVHSFQCRKNVTPLIEKYKIIENNDSVPGDSSDDSENETALLSPPPTTPPPPPPPPPVQSKIKSVEKISEQLQRNVLEHIKTIKSDGPVKLHDNKNVNNRSNEGGNHGILNKKEKYLHTPRAPQYSSRLFPSVYPKVRSEYVGLPAVLSDDEISNISDDDFIIKPIDFKHSRTHTLSMSQFSKSKTVITVDELSSTYSTLNSEHSVEQNIISLNDSYVNQSIRDLLIGAFMKRIDKNEKNTKNISIDTNLSNLLQQNISTHIKTIDPDPINSSSTTQYNDQSVEPQHLLKVNIIYHDINAHQMPKITDIPINAPLTLPTIRITQTVPQTTQKAVIVHENVPAEVDSKTINVDVNQILPNKQIVSLNIQAQENINQKEVQSLPTETPIGGEGEHKNDSLKLISGVHEISVHSIVSPEPSKDKPPPTDTNVEDQQIKSDDQKSECEHKLVVKRVLLSTAEETDLVGIPKYSSDALNKHLERVNDNDSDNVHADVTYLVDSLLQTNLIKEIKGVEEISVKSKPSAQEICQPPELQLKLHSTGPQPDPQTPGLQLELQFSEKPHTEIMVVENNNEKLIDANNIVNLESQSLPPTRIMIDVGVGSLSNKEQEILNKSIQCKMKSVDNVAEANGIGNKISQTDPKPIDNQYICCSKDNCCNNKNLVPQPPKLVTKVDEIVDASLVPVYVTRSSQNIDKAIQSDDDKTDPSIVPSSKGDTFQCYDNNENSDNILAYCPGECQPPKKTEQIDEEVQTEIFYHINTSVASTSYEPNRNCTMFTSCEEMFTESKTICWDKPVVFDESCIYNKNKSEFIISPCDIKNNEIHNSVIDNDYSQMAIKWNIYQEQKEINLSKTKECKLRSHEQNICNNLQPQCINTEENECSANKCMNYNDKLSSSPTNSSRESCRTCAIDNVTQCSRCKFIIESKQKLIKK